MTVLPRLALLLLMLFLATLSACSSSPAGQSGNDGRLRVLATVGMIADIAREVGGEHVDVEQLMPAGVDPHTYVPTRDDVARLQSAQLILYNGLHLEGRMTDTLVQLARTRPVVAVTERLDRGEVLDKEDDPGAHDPHVWMDVEAWRGAVGVVEAALAEQRPQHAAEFARLAAAYRERLAALDAYAKESIASIPDNARILVTAHDAFRYMGRRYGLEVRGVQGLSTQSEAGLADINALVDLVVERRVPAIFIETSVSDKNVRAIVEGARARGHEVVLGPALFSDAMGDAGTYEGTYVGMIDHNVTAIARALGGTAPARGMQGQLALGGGEAP